MIEQEKQLLLADLCARLPYNVRIRHYVNDTDFYSNPLMTYDIDQLENNKAIIKPYLRPMSSMTEEEKKELLILLVGEDSISYFKVENDGITNTSENIQFGHNWQYYWLNFSNENISLYVDWLNSHHFDYRGLIKKGLAIEAPEGMYK